MITRMKKWLGLFSIVLATALLLPQFALAQNDGDDNGNDNDDPPSRAARLSFTSGAVSFEPAGTDDWVTTVANRPITTGDKLWTDKDGRAELRFGSTAVRIGPETGFSFLNLDDNTAQIRLTEGTVNVRVKRLDENETIEIDTPNLAFTVLRPGTYRVSVNEAGDTTVVRVIGGDGEVTGGGASYAVHADQTGTFTGDDQLSADIQGYGDDDDFDRWCSDRDRKWDRSTSAQYVSDDVVGYEDLDDNGGWRPVPEYGTVWFPHTTVVGWAPYRYGHWAWVSPWGWTWVDDAAWGFAPFHYGRWVTVRGVWGWVPCPPRPRVVTVAYVRPVYAPALVAWVGGAHWGVGVAVGGGPAAGVAWFPLGPRDVYCPSYRVGPRYVERVNVSNTVIINRTEVTNVYRNVYVNKTVNVTNIRYQNQTVVNSVTATSHETFTSARPVGRNMVRIDSREVTAAPIAPRGPAVVPQQRSVLGAGAEARVRPPTQFANRAVVARTAPPPAPVSFQRQQQAIQANGGRPVAVSQVREQQTQQTARPNIRMAPPARQMPPQNQNQNQNNVVNRPNQQNQPVQQNRVNPQNQGNRPNQPVQQNQNPAQQNQGNSQNQNKPNAQTNQPPPNNAPNNAAPNNAPNNGNRRVITNDNIPNGGRNNNPNNPRNYNDRPTSARPVNPRLEQKQQQQQENLRQQQDRERQRVEQQQVQQQQKIQQRQPDPRAQQQVQDRQQKQLEQMEQKHDRQQQQLQQKQQRQEQRAKPESKPAKPQPEKPKPH